VETAIGKGSLPGVGEQQDPVRFYPASPLAAPLLGSLNDNGAVAGLELEYNASLTGRPGKIVEAVDPSGHPVPGSVTEDDPATDGDDIVTTIDEGLQYQAEQALATAITKSDATGGTAIVESSRTGQLLAVASMASNGHGGKPFQSASETAFTSVYEPGSVAKLVTISGALASGVVTPSQGFVIPEGYEVEGTVFHDAEDHAAYELTVTGILAQSSNIGAIQIAQREGASTLYHYEVAFGLTSETAIHFPGESSGLVTPLADFNGTTLPTLAFGEDDAVTAAQMLGVVDTIANGGEYVAPRLVTGVIGQNGEERLLPAPAPRRVVSPTVAREVTTMMEQVVSNGTGVAAQVPGYAVAGKTGTAYALKPGGGYDTSRYVSSFAGFVPAQDPEFTIIVVVDHTALYGAEASAPAFAAIAHDALLDFQVPPDGSQPAPSTQAVPWTNGQPELSYMQ
jgi:cell division protein FtsI (penicillin-binding protein 3)